MADPVKNTCSWSFTTATVTTNDRSVTIEHQANLGLALMGSPAQFRDTYNRDDRTAFTRQKVIAGVNVGDAIRVPIARNDNTRIMMNRCANDFSRANNPLWRPVRDVANMY